MSFGLSNLFTIKMEHYKIHFSPTSLSLRFWIDRKDRINDDFFFERYLKPGDTVVDAGANIGSLSLLASSLAKNGKIFSIEANPRTFKYLKQNIALNKKENVYLFNTALGDTTGEIMFSDTSSDDQNKVTNDKTGLRVPIIRLDELNIDERRVSLFKIDVEGFELFVLKGAQELLKKTDCIYFESWERHYKNYNYSTVDVIKFLSNSGFCCYRFKDRNSAVKVDDSYISQNLEDMIAFRDIVLFKNRTGFDVHEGK
jgi:FkbM family methyltransferase